MRQRAPIPAWAQRRNREREAEANDRATARLGVLLGAVLVDVVWSNDTRQPYHPRCRAGIPPGPLGTIDIALDRTGPVASCAHCGRPLDEDLP